MPLLPDCAALHPGYGSKFATTVVVSGYVMSNILIVGTDGTIGAALFNYLNAQNDPTVYGTTRRALSDEPQKILSLDLAEPPEHWYFPDITFSVVYFCAGISNMAFCEDNTDISARVNVEAIKKLITYFTNRNAKIVYLSTNQVFSGDTPHVLAHALPHPRNEYGRQKSNVERFIQTQCQQYAIVRLTKVISPNALPFCYWIEALRNHKPIEAFHDMVIAPISLSYVVEALARIGCQHDTGCYQISGPEDVSYYQLGCYLAQRLCRPATLVRSTSAIEKGIRNIFLPAFTSLQFSSILAPNYKGPLHYPDVIEENFDFQE